MRCVYGVFAYQSLSSPKLYQYRHQWKPKRKIHFTIESLSRSLTNIWIENRRRRRRKYTSHSICGFNKDVQNPKIFLLTVSHFKYLHDIIIHVRVWYTQHEIYLVNGFHRHQRSPFFFRFLCYPRKRYIGKMG